MSKIKPAVAPCYAAHHLHPTPSFLMLRSKGRSKSSPLPFSALDFIPTPSSDLFKPLPLLRPNYFDHLLPKELQLYIFKFLVLRFQQDHAKALADGRWTITKAISSRNHLVGRDRGTRELLKLASVSRSWQNLVYDGQLWADLDLHSFLPLPEETLLRLARSAGPFIRRINFAGHCLLQPATLTHLTAYLSSTDNLSYIHLTAIDLQGCSSLTTRSLHHLLVRCKSLNKLSLKGLSAVTNTTSELLATFCTQLEHLNLSHCPNMDAEAIRSLSRSTLAQGEFLRLQELRISGLKHMDDPTMRLLGKAAPHLEILDLSYVRQLHNSALEAFVAVHQDDLIDYSRAGIQVVRLNSRQIGRDLSTDGLQYFSRRVTKLRHISLSSCILLTDMACSNLAYAVPQLEFLEIAGIGPDLKDDGLIRLLDTTPFIRRIDLEDATDITDSVLSAITPPVPVEDQQEQPNANANRRKQEENPQPGHALEWLAVSHAVNISDEAFLSLVRACTKLSVLEADSTKLSANTLKEFVNLNRQRKTLDAKVVAIDCRNVVEGIVKELGSKGATRPRKGVRTFWARRLGYVDGNDEMCEDDLKVGQDECDPEKVIVKSFYSWQTVDNVRRAREKRRKNTSRKIGGSSDDNYSDDLFDGGHDFGNGRGTGRGTGLTRWWSPSNGGRPGSGRNSPPIIPDINSDACIIM